MQDIPEKNIDSQESIPQEIMPEDQLPGLAQSGIHAGFPSPVTDYMTQAIDLNRELVKHPAATFYGRVVGDSMIDAGVEEGDILVIDKSLDAQDGDMAVCFVDGEFTLKHLRLHAGGISLVPANKKYPVIEVGEGTDFKMWGVVTYVIKKIR
jgi:DNA polymerase V